MDTVPDREEVIEERASANIADVLERGPGLRHSRSTWIIAKDPARGYVQRGGLGGMGIGVMWCKAHEFDLADETYAEAPIADSRGGFGGPPHDLESRARQAESRVPRLLAELESEREHIRAWAEAQR